jgi:phosphosulfolactate phosphohydrolase-like enzyme
MTMSVSRRSNTSRSSAFRAVAALVEILHDMSGALQRVDEKAPEAVIVFSKENLGHGVRDLDPAGSIVRFVRRRGKAGINTP